MPALQWDPSDSIANAPGWRIIGDDFFTCIPPVDACADPAITRLIRSISPEAIPIWRKQLYLPPGEQTRTILAVHHGIATYVSNPRGMRRLFHVEMPAHAKHPRPNQLECIFERNNPTDFGAPGIFLPWDARVYRYLRANYRNDMVSQASILDQILRKKEEERAAARRRDADNLAYRQRGMEQRIARIFENMPSDAWARYQAELRSPRKRSRAYAFMGVTGADA